MSGEKFSRKNDAYQPELEIDWGIPEEVVDNRSNAEKEADELDKAVVDIWNIAQEYHLDPYPTNFEVVGPEVINQIAGYGVPGRFGHWSFGREYAKMKTQHERGFSKIYELVVNGNPSEAYLLENNPVIENKLVIAHVLGHTDFFKNNFRFDNTREDMLQVVEENAARMRKYEEIYGMEEVEKFIDHVISLDDHVDPYQPDRPFGKEEMKKWEMDARQALEDSQKPVDRGEFEDIFQDKKEKGKKQTFRRADMQVPPQPDSDILGYVRNHAEYLEDWQRDVIDIIRSEAIYFFPQRRTKIMNEGWAAYWHKRIMTELCERDLITPADSEKWRKLHSGIVSESSRQLNPYHLGMKMFEYLEEYFNGQLSEEETRWLESQGEPVYPRYDGPLQDSPASEKLREIMATNDDQSIIRNYFDKNIADRLHMYIYEEVEFGGEMYRKIKPGGWSEIRDKLVSMLSNSGIPNIEIVDGNYDKSNQLYLKHNFDGRALDYNYTSKVMPHLFELWQRNVYLETAKEDNGELKKIVYTYNGKNMSVKNY